MQNSKPWLVMLAPLFCGVMGCSFPKIYKADIQQGNVITQEMVNQLRPGMSQRQVRFIMGSPLITDTFHPSRWDYLYSFQAAGTRRQQERISLIFNKDNQLAGLQGDFMPGVSRDQKLLGTEQGSRVIQAEPVDEKPTPGSLLEQLQHEVDSIEPAPIPVPEPLDPQ